MTKVTMPDPVASLRTRLTGAVVYPCISAEYLPEGQHDLITTDQAESYAADKVREAQTWEPIETAPKTGRKILLGFVNSHGNWRTILGRWTSKEEILDEWEDGDLFDDGWYEISVEADDAPSCWLTNPSHWMPLPPPPTK